MVAHVEHLLAGGVQQLHQVFSRTAGVDAAPLRHVDLFHRFAVFKPGKGPDFAEKSRFAGRDHDEVEDFRPAFDPWHHAFEEVTTQTVRVVPLRIGDQEELFSVERQPFERQRQLGIPGQVGLEIGQDAGFERTVGVDRIDRLTGILEELGIRFERHLLRVLQMEIDHLRKDVDLGQLEQRIDVVEAVARRIDRLAAVQLGAFAGVEKTATVVGAAHVAVAVHLDHHAGFGVEDQTAAAEIGAELRRQDGARVAALHQPVERQLEGEPRHVVARIIGQGPVEVKTDVTDLFEAQRAIGENLPFVGQLEIALGVAQQLQVARGFELGEKQGIYQVGAKGHAASSTSRRLTSSSVCLWAFSTLSIRRWNWPMAKSRKVSMRSPNGSVS